MLSSYLVPLTVVAFAVSRAAELRSRRSDYKGSVVEPRTLVAMKCTGFFAVACALVDHLLRNPAWSVAAYAGGLALMVSGFALRAWAARALGELWSTQIEIRAEHQVVTTGPYAWVRHPIYVSLLAEALGAIVMLQSLIALVPLLFLYVPVVVYRLRVEEKAMIAQIGEPYTRYIQRVPALIPFTRRVGS